MFSISLIDTSTGALVSGLKDGQRLDPSILGDYALRIIPEAAAGLDPFEVKGIRLALTDATGATTTFPDAEAPFVFDSLPVLANGNTSLNIEALDEARAVLAGGSQQIDLIVGDGAEVDSPEVPELGFDGLVIQGEDLAISPTQDLTDSTTNRVIDIESIVVTNDIFRVGAEGTSYLDWAYGNADAYGEFAFDAPVAGTYSISVTYAGSTDRPLDLFLVNDDAPTDIDAFAFIATTAPESLPDGIGDLPDNVNVSTEPTAWEGWTTETLEISLAAGENLLRLGGRANGPNIDKIEMALVAADAAAPTDISLDNDSVLENDAGAAIGQLSVEDADDATHSFTVDDDRFEVDANGVLRLKSTESLDFETEQSITLSVTATDSSEASATETFVIAVGDAQDDVQDDAEVSPSSFEPIVTQAEAGELGENNDSGTLVRDADNPETGSGFQGLRPDYSGTGYLDFGSKPGDAVSFTVEVAEAGSYDLNLRYASNGDRPLDLSVNAGGASSVSFPGTDPDGNGELEGFDSWQYVTVSVTLNAGENTISLAIPAGASKGPNLDRVEITETGSAPVGDVVADENGDLALSVQDEVVNADAAGALVFNLAGVDEDIASVEISFDDGETRQSVTLDEDGSFTLDVSGLEDGLNGATVYFMDAVGNRATAAASFILDTSADSDGDLALAGPEEAVALGSAATTFDISGLDADIETLEISLDGGETRQVVSPQNGTLPLDLSTLPIGTATVTLYATDSVGNVASVNTDVILEAPATGALDVTFDSVTSYTTNQDNPVSAPGYVVSEDGANLSLNDNLWKRVGLSQDYTITDQTRIVLDLAIGENDPEIVAVGFDLDENAFDGDRSIFQLGGTQGQRAFTDLRGSGVDNGDGITRFTIDLSAKAGTIIDSLVFISDDDTTSVLGSSTFSNVQLAEAVDGDDENSAPRIVGGGVADLKVDENGSLEIDIPFVDDDGDALNYSFVVSQNGVAVEGFDGLFIDGGVLSGSVSGLNAGLYTVTVTADDGSVTSDTNFDLTINNVNEAPVADDVALEPYFGELGGFFDGIELASFANYFSDPDGDNLTLSVEGLPQGLSVDEEGVISGKPTESGSFGVVIRATDTEGLSNTLALQFEIEGPMAGDSVSVEAESFTGLADAGNFFATGDADASGNKLIRLSNSQSTQVTTELADNGVLPGWYSVSVEAFDENDGEGALSLQIGDTVLQARNNSSDTLTETVVLNDDFGTLLNDGPRGNAGQAGNLKQIAFETPIYVDEATLATLTAQGESGELMRIDRLVFTRTEEPDNDLDETPFAPFTIQAEAGTLTLFDDGSNATVTAIRDADNPEDNDDLPTGLRPDFTGSGYLDFGDTAGDAVTFEVSMAQAGTYDLNIRYASNSDRPLALSINGADTTELPFATTDPDGSGPEDGFDNWAFETVTVSLEAGSNSLSLAIPEGATTGPNLDRIEITEAGSGPIQVDASADEDGNLTLSANDATLEPSEAETAGFSVSGIDEDIQTVEISVDGGVTRSVVTPDASGNFTLDLSALSGAVTATLYVTDATGNEASAATDITIADDDGSEAFLFEIQGEALTIDDSEAVPDTVVRDASNLETNPSAGADGLWDGYTGSGYLDMGSEAGDAAFFDVSVEEAGAYTLSVRYANGSTGQADRPMDILVGGASQGTLDFSGTGAGDAGWQNWTEMTLEVELAAGSNTIRLENVGNTGPNIDSLSVSRDGESLDPVVEPGERFMLKINFQPDGFATPDGYAADTGLAFGEQSVEVDGQTYQYGWVSEASIADGTENGTTPMGIADQTRVAVNDRTDDIAGLDPRQGTYAHFDQPAPGYERAGWEIELEDGFYEVTVSIGDTSGPYDSNNVLNAEGELFNDPFTPFRPDDFPADNNPGNDTDGFRSDLVTRVVQVTDGRLTLDSMGLNNENTEIQYIEIQALPDLTPEDNRNAPEDYAFFTDPRAIAGVGANEVEVNLDSQDGSAPTGVDPNSDIFLGLSVVDGRGGALLESLQDGSVRLFETVSGEEMAFNVNTTGGFDSLTISPTGGLKEFTSYTLTIDGFQDRGENDRPDAPTREFQKFTNTFVTGEAPEVVARKVAFSDVVVLDGAADGAFGFTSLEISPDGSKMYISTIEGDIKRYDVDPVTGGLSNEQVLSLDYFDQPGLVQNRGIIGLTFDPKDPNTLWISDNYPIPLTGRDNGVPDFSGRVSKITLGDGDDFTGTAETYVTGLPRSNGDHVTNSLEFRANPDYDAETNPEVPTHLLYLIQGSNTAMGEPDSAWGLRPERLLNASVMEIDPTRDAPEGGFDVSTEPLPLDGKNRRFEDKDGYPKDEPIPMGDGQFLVFAENGTATVQDAAGNILESFYDPFADDAVVKLFATGTRNAYDLVWHSNGSLYVPTNGSAAGGNSPDDPSTPQNELVEGIEKQDDYLFKVEENGYYGHPNKLRDEYILNGGNPTSGNDTNQVGNYPVGTQPDPNYRIDDAYSLGENRSPNGATEYTSGVFGGNLQGNVLFTEYSGGDDIRSITLDANGNVTDDSVLRDVDGNVITYVDPLDIIENPATGQLYLLTLNRGNGQSQIVRLDPAPGGVIVDPGDGGSDGDGGDDNNGDLVSLLTIQAEDNTPDDGTSVTAASGADAQIEIRSVDNPESNPDLQPTGLRPGSFGVDGNTDDTDGISGGYADFGSTDADFLTFNFELTGDQAGESVLQVRYANGATANRPLEVFVNNVSVGTFAFSPPTEVTADDAWNTWQTLDIPAELISGLNTVRFQATANTGPNIDQLEILQEPQDTTPGYSEYEAESAQLDGPVVVNASEDDRNASGDGFVDFDGATDQSITWSIDVAEAGTYEIGFRYALSATKADRPMDLAINGSAIGALGFPGQSNEDENDWFYQTTTVTLEAGSNTVSVTAPGANGPNVDLLRVADEPLTTIPGDPDADIGIQSNDAAHFSDRLQFNYLENNSASNDDRDFKENGSVVISNTGSADLSIIDADLTGPFELANPDIFNGLTLGAGKSITVEILFDRDAYTPPTTNAGDGVFEGALRLVTNDADTPVAEVHLAGFWQARDEGGWEPNINEVWEVFGFGNVIDGLSTQGGGENSVLNDFDLYRPINDDEVLSRYWKIADGFESAKITQIAAFHGGGGATLGIHNPGNKGQDVTLSNHAGDNNQSLLPIKSSGQFATATITKDMIPDGWLGNDLFGIEVAGLSTDPSLNPSGGGSVPAGTEDIERGYTVRVFQALDADGNVIPNTYLGVMDYTGINYDYNDNMFVIEGIEPASGGEISIENLDGVPSDDRLVMSRIENPANANQEVHDEVTFTINNDGFDDLEIASLEIADPTLFEIVGDSTDLLIPAGSSLNVTVRFIASDSNDGSLYESTLMINSNDGDEGQKVIQLAGIAQGQSESGQEPMVQEIVNAFGFSTNVAEGEMNKGGLVEANGDEILSPYFQRADDGTPIKITQLAAYHGQGDVARLFVHDVDSRDIDEILAHDEQDGQTLLPRALNAGEQLTTTTLDRDGPFGFFAEISDRQGYISWSDPDANLHEDTVDEIGKPGNNLNWDQNDGHLIRVYVAKDAEGNVIPDSYIVIQDYAGVNYDYNDNIFLVENVQTYDPTGAEDADGNGRVDLYDDNDGDGTPNFLDDDVPVTEQTAFNADGTPWNVGDELTLQAALYDEGGQDIAYNDADAFQIGSNFRGEGVDIVGNGEAIGWVADGEWVEYTLNVAEAGTYDLSFLSALGTKSGDARTITASFAQNGSAYESASPVGVDYSGGWTSFAQTDTAQVMLEAGEQVLRLTFNGGAQDLASFALAQVNTNSAPTVSAGLADITATADEAFAFTVPADAFADADGDALTYTANGLPDGLTISPTGVISGTPTAAGSFDILVAASDGSVSVETDFALNVEAAPVDDGQNAFNASGTPWAVGGGLILDATLYDEGGKGIAYSDSSESQEGSSFRGEGVDIVGDGTAIGWVEDGEWVEYTLNVAEAGTYDLSFLAATVKGGRSIAASVEQDGVFYTTSAPFAVVDTNDWDDYVATETQKIDLQAGEQVLRLTFNGGALDLQSLILEPVERQSAFNDTGTPWLVDEDGLSLDAVLFDKGDQDVAYNDTSEVQRGDDFRDGGVDVVGNGEAIGWVEDGEWVEYTIDVEEAGIYSLSFETATPKNGRSITAAVEQDGAFYATSEPLSVPNSGDWDNYVATQALELDLQAGEQVLRLTFNGGAMDLKSLNIEQQSTTPALQSLAFDDILFDEETASAANDDVISMSDDVSLAGLEMNTAEDYVL